MSDDTIKHCCFCFLEVDISQQGDGLRLGISKEGSPAYQEMYAHGSCIAERLDRRVPFLADAWDEDVHP